MDVGYRTLCLIGLLSIGGVGTAAASCVIDEAAQVPFVMTPSPVITLTVQEKRVRFLVDTGAETTAVVPALAQQLNLRRDKHVTVSVGIGGAASSSFEDAWIDKFDFGRRFPMDTRVTVGNALASGFVRAGIGAVLGADQLHRFDVEFDFPARVMTLHRVEGCSGAFVPWDVHYDVVPLKLTAKNLLVIPMRIEALPIDALIDTGNDHTMVTRQAALDAGTKAAVLDQTSVGDTGGAGGMSVVLHQHRFDNVVIGRRVFHGVSVAVGNASLGESEALLGMDFWHSKHIWLSYSTGQMFIQTSVKAQAAAVP